MSISLASPVTGTAMSGLTSPTYTVVADSAMPSNMKQYAVTALGGTQTGVTPHSIGSPFTISWIRPLVYKALGVVSSVTGLLKSVPKNTHKIITRKGVIPLAGQPASLMIITTEVSVPAGADLADPLSVKAALSLHTAALAAQGSGLGDTVVSGIL